MNSARQRGRFPKRYVNVIEDFIEFAMANQKQQWYTVCYSVIMMKEIIFLTQ
ncbi:MAG: hypothetical protein KGJ59_02655 [Bacteroidota bacterium]|nr:hypothetical protein [Bacteroidota bacterium]